VRTLREQIARRCRHFTGLRDATCAASVAYDRVRDSSQAGRHRWPCFSDDGATTTCASAAFLTAAEVETEIATKALPLENIVKARAAIIATKQSSGIIDCPVCGNSKSLRFSVASNGHVLAGCRGCVSWIE
jgi:hypothetical protein